MRPLLAPALSVALIVTSFVGAQVLGAPTAMAAGCASTGLIDGDHTVITFRGAGTCSWTAPVGVAMVDVLVVGGGGGGGGGSQVQGRGGANGDFNAGGGGGGGQVTSSSSFAVSGTVAVTVGAGGSGGNQPAAAEFPYQATAGAAGGASSFGSVNAPGGGGGGTGEFLDQPRAAGDGGASGRQVNGVSTNTTGGLNDWVAAGGGAGAGGNGIAGVGIAETAGMGGAGGTGTSSDITGSATLYGGGGGGGGVWQGTGSAQSDGSGGLGGAGGGGDGAQLPGTAATNGVDGLGGGGGGGGYTNGTASGNGGRGGQGIVVVRYATTGVLVVTTAPGNTVVGGSVTAPVVQVQDGNGNPIAVEGVTVSATLTTGVGTLTNTTATTDISGSATFTGFSLNADPGNYVVTFVANLLTSATSTIQITPVPAPDNGGSAGPPPSPVPSTEITNNITPPDSSTVTTPPPASLAPGGANMLLAGQQVAVEDQPLRRGQGLSVSAGPVSMTLRSTTTNGRAVPLATDGSLLLARSGDLPINVSGLAPGSIATQTLFSEPILLGTATADAAGELASSVIIPSTVPLGSHTLRLQGTTNTGEAFALDVGVTVATPVVAIGASPLLTVKQKTTKGKRTVDVRAQGVQSRCLVTFTAGKHKVKARADRSGTARAQLVGPGKSKRAVNLTARISGKGCAPVQVTRRT